MAISLAMRPVEGTPDVAPPFNLEFERLSSISHSKRSVEYDPCGGETFRSQILERLGFELGKSRCYLVRQLAVGSYRQHERARIILHDVSKKHTQGRQISRIHRHQHPRY